MYTFISPWTARPLDYSFSGFPTPWQLPKPVKPGIYFSKLLMLQTQPTEYLIWFTSACHFTFLREHNTEEFKQPMARAAPSPNIFLHNKRDTVDQSHENNNSNCSPLHPTLPLLSKTQQIVNTPPTSIHHLLPYRFTSSFCTPSSPQMKANNP